MSFTYTVLGISIILILVGIFYHSESSKEVRKELWQTLIHIWLILVIIIGFIDFFLIHE